MKSKKTYLKPAASNQFPVVLSMLTSSIKPEEIEIDDEKEEDGVAEARKRGIFDEESNNSESMW